MAERLCHGRLNLREDALQKVIGVWKSENPNCKYNPVYAKGKDGNNDFVIFFEESGFHHGYFGNNWHKGQADNQHYPIFLCTQPWFPVKNEFVSKIRSLG